MRKLLLAFFHETTDGSRALEGKTEPTREGLSFSFLHFYERLDPDLFAEWRDSTSLGKAWRCKSAGGQLMEWGSEKPGCAARQNRGVDESWLWRHLLTSGTWGQLRKATNGDTFVGLAVRAGKNLNKLTYGPWASLWTSRVGVKRVGLWQMAWGKCWKFKTSNVGNEGRAATRGFKQNTFCLEGSLRKNDG